MPLHLLGKKSWNVYNPANIARVRRDEDAARAREEAEEQRMQQVDADRRLAILRGEIPPPLEQHAEPEISPQSGGTGGHGDRSPWPLESGRKRKRHGEDDTDFEMRVAREGALADNRKPLPPTMIGTATVTTLVDSRGHVSLFPEADALPPAVEKNEEHEREAARKKREVADQYQMRFVNAAGKDGQGLTDGGPWYASADGEASAALVPRKDVWGREDPGRKVREAARLCADDPLAMMKSGAAKVRELDRERRREAEERERELKMLKREERREKKRRRGESHRESKTGLERDDPSGTARVSERDRSHRRRGGDEEKRSRHRSEERDRRRHGEENRQEKHRRRDDDRHRSRHRSYSRDRHRDRERRSLDHH
ncbi:CBF1-interacting co-repressor CIR N-terminal domain-containing protein [Madurella fahalii]|uniref:CBF1-interacting co-repressor CIR N-terminal domain-containing protein n=1 Tax=Madurella fahalii TaxID=1157608 RepID=A0ABQ0G708_9PEZI